MIGRASGVVPTANATVKVAIAIPMVVLMVVIAAVIQVTEVMGVLGRGGERRRGILLGAIMAV